MEGGDPSWGIHACKHCWRLEMRPAVHAAITRVFKQKVKAGEGPPSPDDPGWGAEGGVRRASPLPPACGTGTEGSPRSSAAGWQAGG